MDLVSSAAETYLIRAQGNGEARLRFLRGLWEIQSSVADAVSIPSPTMDAASVREALVSGQPIFHGAPPSIDAEHYANTVLQVVAYVADHAGLPAEHSDALRFADLAGALESEDVSSAIGSFDAFVSHVAGRVGTTEDGPLTLTTIAFVLWSALVPFLTAAAKAALLAVGGLEEGVWSTGHCPVCGADAAMGLMGESSKLQGARRTLWCASCHTEWGYERIRCVRCGSRNPDSLRYTYVEGDPAHRLHLCDECHGYAKFVFSDDLDGPLAVLVEEAVTAPLDAVAATHGYSSTGDGGVRSS